MPKQIHTASHIVTPHGLSRMAERTITAQNRRR